MTRAMVSPRRHEEILTHRTTNRRIVEVECQSDSCFDVEDDGCCEYNNKQERGNIQGLTGPQSPLFRPTPYDSHQQTKRKRRKMTMSITQQIVMSDLFLFFLSLLGFLSLYWCWKQSTSTTEAVEGVGTIQLFEQLSKVGSQSCSDKLEPEKVSFTLATQVSADRLWMMEHQCRRWRVTNSSFPYPISIAVFTNESTIQVEKQLAGLGCDMGRISVSILSAKRYPADDYPVNKLRNLALDAAETSHAVLVDIDFWISQDLPHTLQRVEVTNLLVSDPKATLVIPAFQLHRQCHQWRECPEMNVPEMPLSLKDLKQQIMAHKVTRFDPTNRGGHGSTRYKEWFKQNYENGETLLEIDCFLSNRYEPYLVFRLCWELPPFQEAFAGYGKNKMTWVMQLRRMGYTFWQLGKGAFVIHYPHLDSKSRIAWNNAPQRYKDPSKPVKWQAYKRGRMDQLFVEFRGWLQAQVDDRTRTPFCEDKLDDDARLWYDRRSLDATAHGALQL